MHAVTVTHVIRPVEFRHEMIQVWVTNFKMKNPVTCSFWKLQYKRCIYIFTSEILAKWKKTTQLSPKNESHQPLIRIFNVIISYRLKKRILAKI